MRIRRCVLAILFLSAPAVVASASPASATCDPRKPSTCPIQCPDGFERVALPGGGQICVPDLDAAGPTLQ